MRLIDADAFIKENAEIIDCEIDHPKYQDTLRELIDEAQTIIYCGEMDHETLGKIPYMDLRPRPHGEWVESKERKGHFYCSECVQKDPETGKWRETFDFKYPFCPNCGADMRKEGDSDA